MTLRLRAALIAILLVPAAVAQATEGPEALHTCNGRDLLATASPELNKALDRSLASQPFTTGNRWRAERGKLRLTIVGTLHVADPRLQGPMQRLRPEIAEAQAVYLEATDAEMTAMRAAFAHRPELLYLRDGPSLMERLPEADWVLLSKELQARGIPPVMAARLRPWYATMLLEMPRCALPAGSETLTGLDRMIMEAARQSGVETRALEPFDTVFTIFDSMGIEPQIEMLRAALAETGDAENQYATLLAAYFSEQHRRLWEFGRMSAVEAVPKADRPQMREDFELMEEALLNRRNRAWVKRLREDSAKAAPGPASFVVAVGAAHLSGPQGILALLEAEGWKVTREPF